MCDTEKRLKAGVSYPLIGRQNGREKMKKICFGALALALGLVVGYPVYAVANFIEIDASFVTSTLAYIGQLFTDLKLLIIVIIGLPLAFWAVRRIVGLVRAR